MKWKKRYWKFLFYIFIGIGLFYILSETTIFQTVVGEDGYILLADSNIIITDGWSCTTEGSTCSGKIICNSKYYKSTQTLQASPSFFGCVGRPLTASNTIIKGSDTNVQWTTGSGTLLLKSDLKYKYFRVTAKQGGNCDRRFGNCNYCGCSSSSVYLTDNVPDSGNSYTLIEGDQSWIAGVELIPSVIDPNILVVMLNGEKVKELNISQWAGVYFGFSFNEFTNPQQWSITNPRYQYLFSCQKESNEILGIITYSGGQIISLSPDGSLTSISEPITKFCPTHAAILTDQSEKGSTETNEYYYELAKGNTVNIQDDQTLTLFFLFDATKMAVTCADTEAYDFNTKICKDISGIATFLREGTIDEENGVVIINPEIVCQINEVPEGIYYIDQDACIIYKEANVDCIDAGYVYQASTNNCVNPLGNSIPASKSVEVIKEITESDCKEQYGETATVLIGSDNKAYACYVQEIQSVYYCNGIVINEGDICKVDYPEDITGISLVTQDESVGLQKFNYTLLYIILALVTGIIILFILVQKKRR